MATSILQIDSSPRGEASVSRKLTTDIVAALKTTHPDSRVTYRDFGSKPLPHLTGPVIGAMFTPAEQRTAEQSELLKPSEQAVDDVMKADIIIIGAPMFNFGIPSALKAWVDHIVRRGRTFTYGANGPEGLVPAGKKVIIVSARGGVYSEGPMKLIDHQESYLQALLGFIGLKDVTFVRAEGLSMGEDAVKKAMLTAGSQLAAFVKQAA